MSLAAAELSCAAVVMLCGLPASGKTTTASRLHGYAGGVLIIRIAAASTPAPTAADAKKRQRGVSTQTRRDASVC